MTDDSKPPDLRESIRKSAFHRFGPAGLVVLALLVAVAYVYANWERVSKWPGVAPIIALLPPRPIPEADPDQFSVMVARLENDGNREYERLIVEALKGFEGIQILALDRTVTLEGPAPEEEEKRGHESARRYLKKSGATVLIWGTVLSQGGRTLPKLYWTASHGDEQEPKGYDAPLTEVELRLPEVFWPDMAEILQLLVASRYAEFQSDAGRNAADQLPWFIARVRTLLEGRADRPGWDAGARARTRAIVADALHVFGDQSGTRRLEEAVTAYREALTERTRDRVPLKWAATQNSLALALFRLGKRESGTRRLEEAVATYREALTERTRDRVPLDWATTQNNLGMALFKLGERDSGTGRLEEAVAAYREALKERTRDRVPLDWAVTQNNLGAALRTLGERESGTRRLEEAVAAYREALTERTREWVPLKWATTQNNLGNALFRLGERESGTGRLEEAVAAYRQALTEWTRDRAPLDWATTQNNLGNALFKLGERESGTERLKEAVAAYRAGLEVFERAQATHYVETTKGNLFRAEALLRKRQNLQNQILAKWGSRVYALAVRQVV
jgi:tetratricopeptide (TPR) repeat protein